MKTSIITTYHHSFAGGSKNTSRLLHYLSQNGCNVNAFFFEAPQYFTFTKSNVSAHVLNSNGIDSEVIETSAIAHYNLADKIIQKTNEIHEPVFFGANLFPYCNILADVKSQVTQNTKNIPRLVIHPVGSDIWQIGVQVPSRVKWLLDNPLVDRVITYSDRFISEIKEYFDIERDIYVVPPVLEKERFFPIDRTHKVNRRKKLGLSEDDFIIHHHSSMRKIKCPDVVLDIAINSSRLINGKCVLIMAGPIPSNEIGALGLTLDPDTGNKGFLYKTDKENLTIYWTGVLTDVQYLIQISDVELNASLHDSFNLSLMEAMACGIPVVSSDVVGISDHISKANAGYCFPAKNLRLNELNGVLKSAANKKSQFDIDYAINAIVTLAKNREDAQSMGYSGAKYVVSEFSTEKSTIEFYKHLNKNDRDL